MKIHSFCMWMHGLGYFLSGSNNLCNEGSAKSGWRNIPSFLSPPKPRSLQYHYGYSFSQGKKAYQLCSGATTILLAGIFYYPANTNATESGPLAGSDLGSLCVEACRHLANRLRIDVTKLGDRIV